MHTHVYTLFVHICMYAPMHVCVRVFSVVVRCFVFECKLTEIQIINKLFACQLLTFAAYYYYRCSSCKIKYKKKNIINERANELSEINK